MTKQPGELVIFHQGTKQETRFGNLEVPVFTHEHTCYDAVVGENKMQPIRYASGDTLWCELNGEAAAKPCLTIVIQFFGNPDLVEQSKEALSTWGNKWVPHLEQHKMHVAQRYLYSDNPAYKNRVVDGKPAPVLRVLVLRVYNDADFDCPEHPEFLVGEPMGTYHCPVCNHTQMAGMFHIKEEA